MGQQRGAEGRRRPGGLRCLTRSKSNPNAHTAEGFYRYNPRLSQAQPLMAVVTALVPSLFSDCSSSETTTIYLLAPLARSFEEEAGGRGCNKGSGWYFRVYVLVYLLYCFGAHPMPVPACFTRRGGGDCCIVWHSAFGGRPGGRGWGC